MERLRIARSGVFLARCATNRVRSQRSSFRSRTAFLKNAEEISSNASKPAASIESIIGSIMRVVILEAHRLNCPSRKVVSTKRMSPVCLMLFIGNLIDQDSAVQNLIRSSGKPSGANNSSLCKPGSFILRGMTIALCCPRSEPRSERPQERKSARLYRVGNKLRFFLLYTLPLRLHASSRPIARDRRGSLLGHS